MSNSVPYEIIAPIGTAWIAVVGTSFPAIDANPPSPWFKVGAAGDLNYAEEGIKISHNREFSEYKSLGDLGTRKMFATGESLKISLMLNDLSLEQYQLALNGNSVTTTPAGSGTAGHKKVGLSFGDTVATYALLIRFDASPYGALMNMQYECPVAAQTGNPELVMRKGEPVGLALEWTALVDPNAANASERFGVVRAQHALAL